MARRQALWIATLFAGVLVLTLGYSNCGHIPQTEEPPHKGKTAQSFSTKRSPTNAKTLSPDEEQLAASYSDDGAVAFKFKVNSRSAGPTRDRIENKEVYPPQTFILKVNGKLVTNRAIREYQLALTSMPSRNIATTEKVDAITVTITPRDAFPEPLEVCSKFVMVLDERAQKNAGVEMEPIQNHDDLELRYLHVKETLSRVRGFEVTGKIDKMRQPSGRVICRNQEGSEVNLQIPHVDFAN